MLQGGLPLPQERRCYHKAVLGKGRQSGPELRQRTRNPASKGVGNPQAVARSPLWKTIAAHLHVRPATFQKVRPLLVGISGFRGQIHQFGQTLSITFIGATEKR
jgi:hypothetical protein